MYLSCPFIIIRSKEYDDSVIDLECVIMGCDDGFGGVDDCSRGHRHLEYELLASKA